MRRRGAPWSIWRTSAMAAPTVSPLAHGQLFVPADTVQVQHLERRRVYRGVYRQERDHRYTAGRRYNRAPSHYRRYAYRPYNWQSRGCILVGPVWFCAEQLNRPLRPRVASTRGRISSVQTEHQAGPTGASTTETKAGPEKVLGMVGMMS